MLLSIGNPKLLSQKQWLRTPLVNSRCYLKKSSKVAHIKVQAAAEVSSITEDLVEVLKDEQQFEEENSNFSQPTDIPPGFQLVPKEGSSVAVLKRQFGNEEITVSGMAVPKVSSPESDDDTSSYEDVTTTLEITIQKQSMPDQELFFWCSSEPGKQLQIIEMSLRPVGGEDKEECYLGPDFYTLDDQLIQAVYNYLGERGIDDSMAEYLDGLLKWKDQEEYKNWLTRTTTFLTS
eukprot:TRINITY_DN4416_c0_g1_i2.p2 TRINITY_DN4416_c0_g1~~TRINITY_DN4416_c0_g1_i2.p2  ORF type:complete len:234 (+),score=36.94 TRINITY_DN4416_c0_g1_i2:91-792(+)